MATLAKFWYSESQRNSMNTPLGRMIRSLFPDEPETRALVTVTVEGERIEIEYTEMCSSSFGDGYRDYWPNWKDAVLLYEGTDYKIRVEVLAPAEQPRSTSDGG